MDTYIFAEVSASHVSLPTYDDGPLLAVNSGRVALTPAVPRSNHDWNTQTGVPTGQVQDPLYIPRTFQHNDPSLVERLERIEHKLDALSSRVGATVLEGSGDIGPTETPKITFYRVPAPEPVEPRFAAPFNHFLDFHLPTSHIINTWNSVPALVLAQQHVKQEAESFYADAVARVHVDKKQFLNWGIPHKLQRGDLIDISCTYSLENGNTSECCPETDIPGDSKYFVEGTQNYENSNETACVRVAAYHSNGYRAHGVRTLWPDRILVVPGQFNDAEYPPSLSFLALTQTFSRHTSYPGIRAAAKYNIYAMMQNLWSLDK
ncbi:hypothetical protein CPB83DRAFT_900328 [Crepidotus variabilis]|uniref:Uncharacterized protein n=1 Tax=Crepidotus variabilis TaxID=179855 RepID=A0A9P6JI32_9AGAR|nr:hypothetical protein CPB83DRAFT_900328 [Crepidotus variabilis]